MYRHALVALSLAALSVPAFATDWSQADIDKGLAIVRGYEGAEECVHSAGTEVDYTVEQVDLNKDGTNELIVSAGPKELGNGSSVCFGQSGQNVHLLISDGAGGWKYEFGFDMTELVPHESNTEWPDLEFSMNASCFPIWRYYQGSYAMWKVCDGNKLIYADVAPWIKEGAVPRDAGAEKQASSKKQPSAYVHEGDLSGAEFDHNGSLMAVDPKRGLIIYKEPKASIRDVVKPGDVLVMAEKPWDMYDTNARIVGTSWVFKKGCAPVGYRVEGGLGRSWHTIVLRGEAPVRKKGTCEVAGLSKTSANAELRFENVED
ncbi:hypothetical protein ACC668_17540 [Rhizobium ruizarguesonis]